jgi:hypothetical protein
MATQQILDGPPPVGLVDEAQLAEVLGISARYVGDAIEQAGFAHMAQYRGRRLWSDGQLGQILERRERDNSI